jgi:hypothetical protein
METKHTPGPFVTSRCAVPDWHTQITIYDADDQRVATVFDKAAAALFVASPDLLTVATEAEVVLLELAQYVCRDHQEMAHEIAQRLTGAIAKAREVQP